MSTVEQIEQAVRGLLPEQLAVFRTWFAEYDAAVWDSHLEADVSAGRLDALADEALDEARRGQCTEL